MVYPILTHLNKAGIFILLHKRQNMKSRLLEKRNITPEYAIKMLKKNGIDVDEEQAKIILDFLYILAKSTLKRYFEDK